MQLWEPQTYGNTREILSTIIGKVSVDFPCFPPIKGLFYVHSGGSAKQDIDLSLEKYNPGVPECFEGDDDVGNVELSFQVQLQCHFLIAIGCLYDENEDDDTYYKWLTCHQVILWFARLSPGGSHLWTMLSTLCASSWIINLVYILILKNNLTGSFVSQ